MGFVSIRLGQHGVDGMEKVSSQGSELVRATLPYLDEVINEDIGGARRALRRLVGRRRSFGRGVTEHRGRVESSHSAKAVHGFMILGLSWFQHGHGADAVYRSGLLVKAVSGDFAWVSPEVGVSHVGHHFRHGTEC